MHPLILELRPLGAVCAFPYRGLLDEEELSILKNTIEADHGLTENSIARNDGWFTFPNYRSILFRVTDFFFGKLCPEK